MRFARRIVAQIMTRANLVAQRLQAVSNSPAVLSRMGKFFGWWESEWNRLSPAGRSWLSLDIILDYFGVRRLLPSDFGIGVFREIMTEKGYFVILFLKMMVITFLALVLMANGVLEILGFDSSKIHDIPSSIAAAATMLLMLDGGRNAARLARHFELSDVNVERVVSIFLAVVFYFGMSMADVLAGRPSPWMQFEGSTTAILVLLISWLFLQPIVRSEVFRRTIDSAALNILRSQLTKHHIGNVVSALREIAKTRNTDLVAKFAPLIEENLLLVAERFERKAWPLHVELEKVKSLLGLQQFISPSLKFSVVVSDASSLDLNVPPMLLQPAIENAVEHQVNLGGPLEGVRAQVIVAINCYRISGKKITKVEVISFLEESSDNGEQLVQSINSAQAQEDATLKRPQPYQDEATEPHGLQMMAHQAKLVWGGSAIVLAGPLTRPDPIDAEIPGWIVRLRISEPYKGE